MWGEPSGIGSCPLCRGGVRGFTALTSPGSMPSAGGEYVPGGRDRLIGELRTACWAHYGALPHAHRHRGHPIEHGSGHHADPSRQEAEELRRAFPTASLACSTARLLIYSPLMTEKQPKSPSNVGNHETVKYVAPQAPTPTSPKLPLTVCRQSLSRRLHSCRGQCKQRPQRHPPACYRRTR
jgi:hypothetical protein